MKNSWLDHMRNQLKDHSEPSPEGLWEDIEKQLFTEEGEKIIPLVSTEKNSAISNKLVAKRNVSWKRIAAILLLFLSMGSVFWIGFNNDESVKKVSQTINSSKPNKNSIKNGFEKNIVDDNNLILSENDIQNKPENRNNSQVQTEVNSSKDFNTNSVEKWVEPKTLVEKTQNSVASDFNKKEELTEKPKSEISTFSESKDEPTLIDENPERAALIAKLEKEILELKDKKDSKSQWMVGLQTSGLTMGSAEDMKGFYTMSGTRISLDPNLMGAYALWQTPLTDIMLVNSDKVVATEIKHKNPISVGARVQYQLSDKLGVSTGLQYTKLTSELKGGSDDNYVFSQQILQYIGVPAHFNYQFFEKGKWGSYASLGGQMDVPIDGVLKTNYSNNGLVQQDKDLKLKNLPLQWSATTGVGVQYKLTPRFGIYAEPSLVYYFDNNSNVGSIYQEKPLNFSLRFGLQWNLNK